MKFTKKDVENLKMIRDSDLELNDDLLDSLSKFTIHQEYLHNLNKILDKQEKVVASKYFLRMSTEMLNDFLGFNCCPNLPLDSGSKEDFQLRLAEALDISLSMYQDRLKGMNLMYGVMGDQSAKKMDNFAGKLIDLAKESIDARTASSKEVQDVFDIEAAEDAEDELKAKLEDIRQRAIKLWQQVYSQFDNLELHDDLLDSLSKFTMDSLSKFTIHQGYLNNLEEIYTKQEKSGNTMEWAMNDLEFNSNEDLEKLVK